MKNPPQTDDEVSLFVNVCSFVAGVLSIGVSAAVSWRVALILPLVWAIQGFLAWRRAFGGAA